MDRRNFLQILGLFSGATVLSSCGSQDGQKKLISYLVPPEDGVLPGQALWQPGTCNECPAGCGVLVRVREGRPVKLEGNPDHPVSRGGLCLRGQASLWRLYHPDRVQTPLRRDGENWQPVSWEQAFGQIFTALDQARQQGRESFYLAGRSTGTLSELIDDFCRGLNLTRLPEFELLGHAALRRAYEAAFGIADLPGYRIGEADLLISVGADLLETFANPVGQAGGLAAAREKGSFRWFHLEPHFSLTGANADRRLSLRPGSEADLLAYLLRQLQDSGRARLRLPEMLLQALPQVSSAQAAETTGLAPDELSELAEALAAAENPLLIAGGVATARDGGVPTALLAALLQWSAGMLGRTVSFDQRLNYAGVGSPGGLDRLGRQLQEGRVGVLFVSRADPVLHAPSPGFAEALGKAGLRVGLVDVPDATTRHLDLLLPLSHALESWGDAEPRRGLRTLIRPAAKPLHDTREEGEVLLGLLRKKQQPVAASYQEHLFAAWEKRYSQPDLEAFARTGFIEEALPAEPSALDAAAAAGWLTRHGLPAPATGPQLVVVPSLRSFDGRSRVIPLLEEIPDPLTTISYGGWVSVSPADAERLKLADGDLLRIAGKGLEVELPAKIQPGLQGGIFLVQRDHLPSGVLGIDPQSGEALLSLDISGATRVGGQTELPILAGSSSQQGRGIIPDPVHLEKHPPHPQASLYPEHAHPDYRWAMAIDLKRCTGCSACVAACYIENHVPVVGKKDHLKGREMSWLRIEPFYDEQGRVEFLPMLCQHCHSAPCEPVCPVYAAYHNGEGLNVQVYARCVGTRYCSNNCPYKVRRFNWWDHRRRPPLDKLVNPDLPLRTRGMMEKCTFCIQRIRAGRDAAKDEGRKIRDGEVVTACAQSCPAKAIAFGNLLDETSQVYRWAHSKRAYRVFEELGTQPSVYYLR
ncbi:Fe-S-cluster-containing hydrogenase [Desulfuromonas versatilis]|uniref:Fe-S-cluster-containing hydrogenase n=1 Tax=Desulfuromonas versatilis TaxID=2802975 RepID=A0ABM8HM33_9BACT|nr:4Fe-4S dicluster domain-containing protein [Desulfuromonas versatilis]BCR03287.1 Fe-S-cluster-containing hydrogenase [Desulfuromonas versatilis]